MSAPCGASDRPSEKVEACGERRSDIRSVVGKGGGCVRVCVCTRVVRRKSQESKPWEREIRING